jgi:hypothetical protein
MVGKVITGAVDALLKVVAFALEKSGSARTIREEAEKDFMLLKTEIKDNYDLLNRLKPELIKKIAINDEAFQKTVSRLTTTYVDKALLYPQRYPQVKSKKTAPFLSALYSISSRIRRLKAYSALSDKERALHKNFRVSVRVKNILDVLTEAKNGW